MKGNWPIQYVRNPNIQKPIEKIWDDLDGFTFEYFEDNGDLNKIDLFIPIPPLSYRGKFTKGLLMTQASEYLLKQYPDLRKLFFIGAYSMCSADPWWDGADVYFVCYENKAREIHHKNKYRKKKDIICLPLQDADYTDEATDVISKTTATTSSISKVAIWEPNANYHVDYTKKFFSKTTPKIKINSTIKGIIDNYTNLGVNGVTTNTDYTLADSDATLRLGSQVILPTYALTAASVGKNITDVYDYAANSAGTYYKMQNTLKLK